MKTAFYIVFGIVCTFAFGSTLYGQMKLRPSDEWFALACENIKIDQAELLRREFNIWINTNKAAIHGPFSDARKRKVNEWYLFDVMEYLSYINAKMLNKQGEIFLLSEIVIETGRSGVKGKDAPVFVIKMTGVDSVGQKIEIERAAKGPAYSVFKVHNVVSDPIAVRSANIALFAAVLRAVLAIDEQCRRDDQGTEKRNSTEVGG